MYVRTTRGILLLVTAVVTLAACERKLAVPAPSLTSVSPDVFCAVTNTALTLTGDFFLRGAIEEPRILIAGQSLAPTSMANCRSLPENAGLEVCTEMLFEVRA